MAERYIQKHVIIMYKALVGNIRMAKDLGREEAYKEVLRWLDENFYNKLDMIDCSFDITGLNSVFSSKEQMIQSFKERFNIE